MTSFALSGDPWTEHPEVTTWIAVLAALTMIVGNLLALPQTNLKRLLAYSGVAQIGYVLLALAAGTGFAAGMALYYYLNVARWMFIVPDEGPRIELPGALLVALLICGLLVLGGGLVPRLFVDPALRAVAGF